MNSPATVSERSISARSRAINRSSLALTESVAEACQTVIYRNGAADFALGDADIEAPDYASAAALVVTGTALAAEPSRGRDHDGYGACPHGRRARGARQ